jgi:hypothetical protein
MEVRLRGLPDKVLALVDLLDQVVEVVSVSAPRRDRGPAPSASTWRSAARGRGADD